MDQGVAAMTSYNKRAPTSYANVASLERYYHAPGRGIDQLERCL
jgi:hypothetical protein